MKLASGKRIGQSGHELSAAVLFSFFIHVIFLFFAVFFYLKVTPRSFAPPFYDVKLVGLAGEPALSPLTPATTPPVEPPQEKKPEPKAKKAAPRASAAEAKKSGMPELAKGKTKLAAPAEEERPAEAPAGKAAEATPSSGGENVNVITPPQSGVDDVYIGRVRYKIGQYWRPPPDAPDAKARVLFSINRSGWVEEVNLDSDHSKGNFGFQQAAIRAIRASNPFPPLPDEFPKQTLEFSVDLTAE